MLESLKQNNDRKVYSFSGMLGMRVHIWWDQTLIDPVDRISNNFIRSLSKSTVYQYPFRHWVLANSLPPEVLESIVRISVEAPSTEALVGTQRSEFEGRFFFSPNNRFIFPVCDDVARAFQSLKVIQAVEACADIKLKNTQLNQNCKFCISLD